MAFFYFLLFFSSFFCKAMDTPASGKSAIEPGKPVIKISIKFRSTITELPENVVIVLPPLRCSNSPIKLSSLCSQQLESMSQAKDLLRILRSIQPKEEQVSRKVAYSHDTVASFFNLLYGKQNESRIASGDEIRLIPSLCGKQVLCVPCGFRGNPLLEVAKLTDEPVDVALPLCNSKDLDCFARLAREIPGCSPIRSLCGIVPSCVSPDNSVVWNVEIARSVIKKTPSLFRPFTCMRSFESFNKVVIRGLQKSRVSFDVIIAYIMPLIGIYNIQIIHPSTRNRSGVVPLDTYRKIG